MFRCMKLGCHIERGTEHESVREQGAEGGMWAQEGRLNSIVEETKQRGILCSVLLTKGYSGDQIKKNEMGSTCGTYRGNEKRIQGVGEI